MTLVLALPFILYAFSGWIRIATVGITVLAVVLSASRTSLITLAVLVLAIGLTLLVGRRRASLPLVALCGTALAVSVVLPYTTGDASFTERGTIWRLAGEFWSTATWFGQGPYAFARDTDLSTQLLETMGYTISHGHNTYVTLRTEVGLVGTLMVAALVGWLLLKAYRAFEKDPTALYFLVVLTVLGVLETPLRFDTVVEQSWIAWGGVFVIALLQLPHVTEDLVEEPSVAAEGPRAER
jgi:O-antigen ligase